MSRLGSGNYRVGLHVCLFCLATLFATPTYGQNATNKVRLSVPEDWSHHHLIFSTAPLTEGSEISQEPRYWHQYHQRNVAKRDRGISKDSMDERQGDEDRDKSRGGRIERNEDKANNTPALSLHRDWSMDMGSGAAVGERTYPAKFSFDISSANCGTAAMPDFVVFNTGLVSSTSQAGIIAYDNLYSGCGGTVPSVYWAYNLGNGAVPNSVVLSADGLQVGFVQNNIGFGGVLRLLKWKPNDGTVTSPSTPTTTVDPSLYRACTAPCSLLIDISGGANYPATFSAPFYDYSADVVYVADDGGYVYKITGAFRGTPAMAVLANTGSTDHLTGPVQDSVSGNLFLGGRDSGKLFAISPAGIVTASAQIGTAAAHGVGDAPIVDSSAGKVYAFVAQDMGSGAGVFQFPTNFAPNATGTEAILGVANTSVSGAFSGAFDDTYYTSSSAASPTGYLYSCGYSGAAPALFRVAINSGVMGAVQQGPLLGTSSSCSPVTEILNGTTDWIYLSVQGAGSSFACSSGGCALSFIVTQWKPNTSYGVNSEFLDSNFNVQIEENFPGGSSGSSMPTWATAQYSETADSANLWLNQGPLANLTTPWQASHAYAAFGSIVDSNGFIQVVLSAGTSNGSPPFWSDAPNSSTIDGSVTWVAVGPTPGYALSSVSGTSAIIIDNTVASGTPAGASQIYYSPLGNQTCAGNGTTGSGTGGCAVQASQAGLQ
jgi:hypothetical protein